MGGALAGLRVVVSAGPTFEDIDPVRFIGNRSSGKMGFAVAAAAAAQGAEVMLVAGPVHLPTPQGVLRHDVRSAAQMHDAVMAALPAEVYIGAAAVADFTPQAFAGSKIKKQVKRPHPDTRDVADSHQLTEDGLVLRLVRTRDILADVAAHASRPRLVVGFAAETDDVEAYARGKLQRKRIDMIAANRVGVEGSGFESDDNALAVFWNRSDGTVAQQALGPADKHALAAALLDLVAQRLQAS
jgi:phosphopantothenoylcysteine decarboxylase/phosphopantothenate--cysteine ligase